jgi:hypothetical protein
MNQHNIVKLYTNLTFQSANEVNGNQGLNFASLVALVQQIRDYLYRLKPTTSETDCSTELCECQLASCRETVSDLNRQLTAANTQLSQVKLLHTNGQRKIRTLQKTLHNLKHELQTCSQTQTTLQQQFDAIKVWSDWFETISFWGMAVASCIVFLVGLLRIALWATGSKILKLTDAFSPRPNAKKYILN